MFEADQTHSLPRENLDTQAPGISPRWPGSGAPRYTFANGEVVFGRFRIIALLGAGGMGEVYEAEDRVSENLESERVALKTIRGEILGNPALLDRFRREVHLARRVSHPGVCRIHELFSIESRQPGTPATLFLSMELLKGQTLAQKLQQDGPYPWREAEILIRAVCHALEAIHAEGVIHRDLKPSNIMLVEKDGACRVVLTDFGLALDTRTSDTRAQSTNGHSPSTAPNEKTGLAGTLDYMAPEQFLPGHSAGNAPITPATDIYALGILLYELVTGKNPYAPEEEAQQTPNAPDGIDTPAKRHITTDPVEAAIRRGRRPPRPSSVNPGIPHGWDKVIYRCLEYHPGSRYQTAKAVAQALHTHRTTAGRLTVQTKSLAKRPAGWALAATLLAATAAGTWYWHVMHEYHHLPPALEKQYEEGLTAIREGTYVKATRILQDVEERDPRYAMTHARLAEAWSELDFSSNAQDEMLRASTLEQQQHLPDTDTRYIHAIRDTLTHDQAGAAKEYRDIVDLLPEDQKSVGYVDLGRAYEKQGKIQEALSSYQTAAKLAPDSPAAFVRIAVLQSAANHRKLADLAFAKAESMYRTEVNEEGQAEVAYRRGYAANNLGDSAEAERYLNQAIEIARQIASPWIEICALTQLSDVHSETKDEATAVEEASKAIQMAQDNGLRYWEAMGLVRLGGAYLNNTDPAKLAQAERPLLRAIQIAQHDHYSRPEAEAKLNLASLRDLQHRPADVIPLARDARDIYTFNGNLGGAMDASSLLVRSQLIEGDLSAALYSSSALVSIADNSESLRQKMFAEDILGDVLRELERYPEALEHHRRALAFTRTPLEKEAEAISIAEDLRRLGKLDEAEKLLPNLSTQSDSYGKLVLTRARLDIDRGHYAQALSLIEPCLATTGDDIHGDLLLTAASAELHLGHIDSAAARISEALAGAAKQSDKEAESQAKLLQIQVLTAQKSYPQAQVLAEQMARYFHATGQHNSESKSESYRALSRGK